MTDIDIKHTFSKNSWHARLNRYIYGWSYVENVDCLCPYFWGTILAILALPLWLLCKGVGCVIDYIEDKGWRIPRPNISRNTKNKINNIIGYGFLGLLCTIFVVGIGFAIINYGIWEVLKWAGILLGVIGACFGVALFGICIYQRYQDWRDEHPRSRRPNIVIQYIKAKKDKHCPRVIWKN